MFSAYCGSTGGGKTYEVVENIIVKGLGQGRRVLTNVTGLNEEKIRDYLVSKGHSGDGIGTIVQLPPIEKCVGRFAVIEELDTLDACEPQARLVEEKSLVRGGDIVVLDEVWRIWRRGQKIHPDDEKFWRMHRHLLHADTKQSTDVVLVTQNWTDLNPTLRGLVHQRFFMKKHLALGRTDRYRVDVFDQGARKPHVQYQRAYKPEIFALYKSHSLSAGAGREDVIDERSNVLGKLLRTTLPLIAFFFLAGGGYLYWWMTQPARDAKKAQEAAKDQQGKAPSDSKSAPGTPAAAAAQSPEDIAAQHAAKLSPWRVVGYAASPSGVVLFIDVNGVGLRQVTAPADSIIFGQYVELEHDGRLLGTFSGSLQPPQKSRGQGFPGTN